MGWLAACTSARTADTSKIVTSVPDMIHCARAATFTPRIAGVIMARNQPDPASG